MSSSLHYLYSKQGLCSFAPACEGFFSPLVLFPPLLLTSVFQATTGLCCLGQREFGVWVLSSKKKSDKKFWVLQTEPVLSLGSVIEYCVRELSENEVSVPKSDVGSCPRLPSWAFAPKEWWKHWCRSFLFLPQCGVDLVLEGKAFRNEKRKSLQSKECLYIPTPKGKNSSSEEFPRPISDAMLLTN